MDTQPGIASINYSPQASHSKSDIGPSVKGKKTASIVHKVFTCVHIISMSTSAHRGTEGFTVVGSGWLPAAGAAISAAQTICG